MTVWVRQLMLALQQRRHRILSGVGFAVCARLLGVVVTLILLVVINFLPFQTRILHYNPNNEYALFSDVTSEATWLDDYSFSRFKCAISRHLNSWCGFSIAWPKEPGHIIDFSEFHSLRLRLKYVGPSQRIRIYARNFNASYSDPENRDSDKFQSTVIDVGEFNQVVTIPFAEFIVADWWVQRYEVSRQFVQPDFSAVRSLAIDYPQPGGAGEHVMEVQRIELVGDYIAKETAYLCLLIFWMGVVLAEGAFRYYRMNQRVEIAQARALNLMNYARELKTQSSLYKKLSTVDALTGIYNRSGARGSVQKIFAPECVHSTSQRGALMVIDIDHFKHINDSLGHGVGDTVIKQVAQVLSGLIGDKDVLARWGGEEFLLVCPQENTASAEVLAERLRFTIQSMGFGCDHDISVTISIGVAMISAEGDFDGVFNNADQALYDAKRLGRNRAVVSKAASKENA
ncbi:MAG TPA: GGDEF domain-containing protein [Marinagarivorans sp.]